MKHLRRFSDWRFASKMLLLVGLMGLMAVLITAYALANMRIANQQTSNLIAHEAQGALTIAEAARNLDSASRLAYTVLTEPDEVRMLALLDDLQSTKSQFDAELDKLARVLPTEGEKIKGITAESQHLFETDGRIITAAARWRGDQALQIIHGEFEPSLLRLRSEMDKLRDGAISRFNSASADLSRRSARTILITALAIIGALALVIPLSAYVVITQMSRPISQLTHTMQRMSQRRYDDEVLLANRHDEVGQMAKALQIFQRSMQREDRLAIEVAASAEARRLSEQLVDLISAIPGTVFQMQIAPDGLRRIVFTSESAAHLYGRTVAELQETPEPAGHEFALASKEQVRSAHDLFMSSVRTLEPLDFDTEITLDARSRWIKTLAAARRSPDGSALFNGVWLDVTEQKEQAQALTQAKNLAEKAAEDKARFLATMSHEIRTPLNAMLGMTQLAMRYEADRAQRERLEKTMRAGRHLLNIVNDVLDISKIEAGKMVIESEDFAPREWLDELRELLFAQAQEKGLDLQLQIAPTTPDWIRGDRQRMSQILINYVNNSIKFTKAGGITVAIDAPQISDQGTLLRCCVQDTGMGITESDQAALFTAFAQADSSITRRFGGTGLGLAISRQLAQLMGGTAGMSSAPGKGSTFWFTARVTAPEAPAAAIKSTSAVNAEAGSALRFPYRGTHFDQGIRVLLVDDNELNRAVAHGMLEVGGITVDEACNGAQALAMLEAAKDNTYALVLMDMQMPVMDGLTASRTLREQSRFAQLPIIALTANASDDDIARTRAVGMNDHLSKPLLEETLWRCLGRWLQRGASVAEEPPAQFDATMVTELRDSLGAERADALMTAFGRDCNLRLVRMEALVDGKRAYPLQWDALAKEAHDLSGSAGSFGLNRLGDLAHQLRPLILQRDDVAVRLAITQLLACARVDLTALENHREKRASSSRVGANV